ncbi:MAG TPA: DUF222 domain-containing protein [Acidimicrobiia bacterium]|nr:DUF222 domain-containing protein [Acidimicrobiia bacterium]
MSSGTASGLIPAEEDQWVEPDPRTVLPEGLAEMAPGPELGSVLGSIDRDELNGYELIEVLKAEARQISYWQARFDADLIEMAHTPWGDATSEAERISIPDELALHELRPALMLTRRAAGMHFDIAFSLARLPHVRQALREGRIDLPRAKVLCHETEHLTVPEAHEVVNQILERAPRLTTGQLGARLRRLCLEIEPDTARQRYQEGLQERRVERGQNPDGTADLLARRLPVDRVAAIMARLNARAKQLKGKDGRSMDQIRADLLLDLLEGKDQPAGAGQGAVEVRVDLTTLMQLDDRAAEIPGWGPIISDLARRVADEQARWEMVVTDPDTGQPIHTQPQRRRPTAALARHIVARDQRCIFIGCRTPAQNCQIDHTHPHSEGGSTDEANLEPLCDPDHGPVKHEGGWDLYQPRPGYFLWISPRGHHYQVSGHPP